MIKNILENIGGISIYGIISLCLFFSFFTGMLIWVFCLRKPYLQTMRELPLDDKDTTHQESEINHNS